ncbi:DUF1064 domain-containing protein [Ligilactobacillus acidipiscis]|uniref:DUF1064 domain-containing protein n=1 Tax=Ligilactobacillus acidipiscis TaxID=89059 RepID=UPI0023F9CC0B|nr:DUF1064 domain-containing protein [Ligilactobacillus acidipiscis]WEV56145.1 DUF1064 domain-containing protein [Ligilactobacillus acidipiscis]
MKHFARKVEYHGYKFDSIKERDFFERFIEKSGYRYEVHPHYTLRGTTPVKGIKIRGIAYTPDFVIYDDNGSIGHVCL